MNTTRLTRARGGEFGNETIDVSDSDVEIVNNDSSGAAPSRRSSCSESNEYEGDHEITETISGPTQPQTYSLLSILKAPTAASSELKLRIPLLENKVVEELMQMSLKV